MEFLLALAFLACPLGMGLMMWFMAKGMRKEPAVTQPPTAGGTGQPRVAASVEQLREEHRRLGEELERIDGQAGYPVAGRS